VRIFIILKDYNKLINVLSGIFIIILALILLSNFFYLYSSGYNRLAKDKIPVINGDGASYYSYLPYYLLNWKNIHFERLYSPSDFDPTGNKYNIGEAVLILPFFLAAHLISIMVKYPLDGYSYFYQIFAGLSGLFYGLSGIYFLKKVLERYFSKSVTLVILAAIIFGTNLYNYLTSNILYSHSFSFFLFAALIYYLPIFYANSKSIKRGVILAIIFGLLILIRLTNILSILIIVLYGIYNFKDFRDRIILSLKNYRVLIIFIIIVLLIFIPQLITWKLAFNKWVVYSYGKEGFDFINPFIANSLFSLRRGLFFYSPILIFSILGIWFLKNKVKEFNIAFLIFISLIIFINSSWFMWWFGSGFGNRSYIEFLPLFALPLASFYSSLKSKKIIISISIISVVLIIFTLIRMYWYWKGLLPMDEVTLLSYRNVIFK